MNLAALASIGSGYLGLAFLPPIIWLLIYLREDTHPEPWHLLILTFVGGMGGALVALYIQKLLLSGLNPVEHIALFFAIIAITEEYIKYLVVKLLIEKRPDFDEPIDAMVYMVTAALGFAAMENALFLYFQAYNPQALFSENLLVGATLSAARFIGANQLHALASAVVGYFLARAWFHPQRHHFVALGLIIAVLLHTFFNYLIIVRDKLPGSLIYIVLLLGFALVIVLAEFHSLKKQPPEPSH